MRGLGRQRTPSGSTTSVQLGLDNGDTVSVMCDSAEIEAVEAELAELFDAEPVDPDAALALGFDSLDPATW